MAGESQLSWSSSMTLLTLLHKKCSSMQTITISGNMEDASYLSPEIFNLPSLRKIDLSLFSISWSAIAQLASLPNLSEVRLIVPKEPSSSTLAPSSIPDRPFPSIQRLSLSGVHLRLGIGFVKTLCRDLANLAHVHLRLDDEITAEEMREFFWELSKHICADKLTNVSMDKYDFSGFVSNQYRDHDFESLMQFRNLQYLNLTNEFSMELLSDNLLEAMAISWPHLRGLHLGQEVWQEPSECTLSGILHLARRCSHLRALAIVFMASAEMAWNGRPGDGVICSSLEYFHVGPSPITNPRAVASFLSDVFPNIKQIGLCEYIDPDDEAQVGYLNNWRIAVEKYKDFVEIRQEERAWNARTD